MTKYHIVCLAVCTMACVAMLPLIAIEFFWEAWEHSQVLGDPVRGRYGCEFTQNATRGWTPFLNQVGDCPDTVCVNAQGIPLCAVVIPFFITVALLPLVLRAPPYSYLAVIEQMERNW